MKPRLTPIRALFAVTCLVASITGPALAGPDGATSASYGDGSGGGLTLEEAIRRALVLDPTVRKKYADVTEASGHMRELRSDLGPQLRLEGSAGWANRDRSIDGISSGGDDLFSRQIGLVLEQLVYDGGFHWFRWKDAEKRLEGEQLLETARRETTAFEVVNAFHQVIRAREHIVLARTNVDLHRKVMELSRERAEAAGNQSDINLATARFRLAETLLKERELALKQADVALYRYTALRPRSLVRAKQTRIGSRYDIDVTRNFHYQAALLQRDAAGLAKKAVQARYHPRVLLRGRGGVGEDVLGIRGADNEGSALLVVQWDIFDSGRKAGLMEQAIADIDRQTGVIDETLLALSQDVDTRWEDYSTLGERISILESYRDELNKTVALYQEQFDLGTRPLLSLLDIQNEEVGARIRLVDERSEYQLATYRLHFFGGNLISNTVGPDYLVSPPETTTKGRYEVHPTIAAEAENSPAAAASVEQKKPARMGTRVLNWFKRG